MEIAENNICNIHLERIVTKTKVEIIYKLYAACVQLSLYIINIDIKSILLTYYTIEY